MELDFALLSFDGVNSAVEAFATARDRSGGGTRWTSEAGFVEHHESGKLVLRGTFAGDYVDVDEALHVSGRGTDEGEAYAAKLRLAGVPVTTVRYDGTIHDFMLLNPLSQTHATRAAIDQATAILRHALGTN